MHLLTLLVELYLKNQSVYHIILHFTSSVQSVKISQRFDKTYTKKELIHHGGNIIQLLVFEKPHIKMYRCVICDVDRREAEVTESHLSHTDKS